MPLGLWNVEWLASNEERAYPFFEEASRTDTTGEFKIPDQLLCALQLSVPCSMDASPDAYFVSGLNVFSAGLTLNVSYDDGTASPPLVATSVVPFSSASEFNTFALSGVGVYDDVVGRVVIGKLDQLLASPPGTYSFTPVTGQLDTDCIRPQLRGVGGIVVINGSDSSIPLRGTVELQAGTNARLSVSSVGGAGTIRLDAISGEGLNADCGCGTSAGPPIMTINGIGPDPSGNFTLGGTDCMQVGAATNGLNLNDTCSSPCAGCGDLQAITNDLATFASNVGNLVNFLNGLEASVTQSNASILGSRLSDQGCPGCS